MGKFENGKYVCIIKWCFRRTKCGWMDGWMDGWTERGERMNKREIHTHSHTCPYGKDESKQENKTKPLNEWRRSRYMCGWHRNEQQPEGAERKQNCLLYEISHPKTPDRWGEQGKKRKIVKLLFYILFSFMYAWNSKNGELLSSVPFFVYFIYLLCTVGARAYIHMDIHI